MINEASAKQFCCEDISLIRGYERAVNDTTQVYDIHHLDGVFYTKEQLIAMGMYYKVPAMALLFMTRSEHRKIHCAFNGNGLEGREVSNETRRKISDKLKGIPNLALSVKISQLTLDGELVAEHDSIRAAQIAVGRPKQSHICACCKGKLKSAYGYIWRYTD